MKQKNGSTTKKIVGFLIGNFVALQLVVIIFTALNFYLAATHGTEIDYSPLTVILTSVIGEVVAFLIYSVKAGMENRKNGITYETAMKELELNRQDDDERGE